MKARVTEWLAIPDVLVSVDKFGDSPFLQRKVTGIVTDISLTGERLEITAAIAAEADYKYHDMLAEAVDGGARKNRVNGVYVVSLPNGARGLSRATRKSVNPLVAEGICSDRDVNNEKDRAVLLIATAALSLVMLDPVKYIEQHAIESGAIRSVFEGKAPAKLLSSMPDVLW